MKYTTHFSQAAAHQLFPGRSVEKRSHKFQSLHGNTYLLIADVSPGCKLSRWGHYHRLFCGKGIKLLIMSECDHQLTSLGNLHKGQNASPVLLTFWPFRSWHWPRKDIFDDADLGRVNTNDGQLQSRGLKHYGVYRQTNPRVLKNKRPKSQSVLRSICRRKNTVKLRYAAVIASDNAIAVRRLQLMPADLITYTQPQSIQCYTTVTLTTNNSYYS